MAHQFNGMHSGAQSNEDLHGHPVYHPLQGHHAATMPVAMPSTQQNFAHNGIHGRAQTIGGLNSNFFDNHQAMYTYNQNPSYHQGFEPLQEYQPHMLSDPGPSISPFSSSPRAETSALAFALGPPQQPQRPTGPIRSHSSTHEDDDGDDSDNAGEYGHSNRRSSAALKDGACARCKGLKVKCVKPPNGDPCKRCLKAGQECVVLGRKKRRNPPKRELLQAQITAQAAEIQNLLAQLEGIHGKRQNPASNPNLIPLESSFSDTGSSSYYQMSPGGTTMSSPNLALQSNPVTPSKELDQWIAKARDSIREFPGLNGASSTREALGIEELEDTDSDGDQITFDFIHTDEAHDFPNGHGHHPTKAHRKLSAMLPTDAAPFGLLAKMALSKRERRLSDGSQGSTSPTDVGITNPSFFAGEDADRPHSPKPTTQAPPILAQKIISSQDAEDLFKIYYDYMNLSVSLLDPTLYSAAKTCLRSSFLFTVVCAIASRYWRGAAVYTTLMRYAQLAAGTALISGDKNVETVHAYILLSLYPVPAHRFEDDRGWIYIGMAIRVAMDLNLQHPLTAKAKNEHHAREMRNRTRAWLNCFNLDISFASQYGKAPTISPFDYVASHSADWWQGEFAMEHFDIHLCCYNSILRQLSQFRSEIYSDRTHPTGLNKNIDLVQIAADLDDQIQNSRTHWMALLEQTDQTNTKNHFRTSLLKLNMSYQRLLALSFGFQHSLGKGSFEKEEDLLRRCLRAASDVVDVVVREVGSPGHETYLRHGPPAQCVFMTFAAAFLIKLLEPKYAIKFPSVLGRVQRLEIRALVEQVISLLGSSGIAIDDSHHPKLYSRFMQGLLDTDMARVGSTSPVALEDQHAFDPVPNSAPTISSYTIPFPDPDPPKLKSEYPDGMFTDIVMNTPLPFDGELLLSMQTLIHDPNVYGHDNHSMLPGFNWMRGDQGTFYDDSPSPDMFDQFRSRH